ncbi:MAG: nickel pincer cofactor biosynthesis protein LarC [Deltaproteobacteria bacterium]|nr:nickel pincer cofactor biosynthesis protein LarC [Deltaproteobacteria bacterium]
MKTAYLDAFSGLAGDMMVGALIDCELDFASLTRALASLPLTGYRLAQNRRVLSGISAVKFEVDVSEPQPERHLGEIAAMIDQADALSQTVKRRAKAVFEVLAEAEGKIHNTPPGDVHFHEVGAVDSIIDVVGVAWALDALEIGEVLVSPLPGGRGFARSQHGIIPVPAPATAQLLAGFPLRLGDGAAEMVTPTGAAVLKALARPAAVPLSFEIERVGYGAGSRTLEDRPNVLRVMIGHQQSGFDADEMIEIQANIDDLNPQVYDHVVERLFAAAARDVTLTPTMMKKGRPGVVLGVLAEAQHRDVLARIIFAETSTIGLRFHPVSRLKLPREIHEIETSFGKIRVKVSRTHRDDHSHHADGDRASQLSPEYDDCRRAALEHGVPLRIVMEEAREAARRHLS